MSESNAAAETATEDAVVLQARPQTQRNLKRKQKKQPPFNVILWDDNDHTYEYVILMIQELFRHSLERAYQMACEVDATGRVICLTTSKEHAELKRDQIHAYGKDPMISRCKGSMSATIESAEA